MDFISPNHFPHIGLLCGINYRIAYVPLAEAGLAGNPWLLFSQIDLFFSRCHHLKGIVLLLGFSPSNFAQIFECPKAADKNDFNSGDSIG